MKDVQCYELFGGIAPKNHAFFHFHNYVDLVYDASPAIFAVGSSQLINVIGQIRHCNFNFF